MVAQITSNEFKAVTDSPIPSLVYFWAPWCGPCKTMAPIVSEIEEELDEVTFAKVNVDDNESLQVLKDLGVNTIPAFMVFKNGKLVDIKTKACSKNDMKQFILKAIA